jgi:hypothetical protein
MKSSLRLRAFARELLPALVLGSAVLLAPTLASTEVPMTASYPECGQGGECPSDYDPWGEWDLGSGHPAEVPEERIPEDERPFGSGNWVDRAWNVTTGRTDVVIAVMDSGIEWDQGELLNKHLLNAGELPFPQDADGNDIGAHDLNGDGVFNMEDWQDDPRVQPDSAGYPDGHSDHMKDPGDLIALFSDAVDDDGNGFIDDICGWDFFWNDNDPYDEIQQDGYSHGSKEARWSLAEGDGAGGSIGSCPNCMLLPLRVGDGFVADSNNFASAALYAVDHGASVIQQAIGGLGATTLTTDALDYAWDNGVTVVGSAADETAWHANQPSAAAHVLYVHAIRHDANNRESTSSWFAFSNCTNYGGRLELSIAAEGCSSGAVGRGSGIAGLMHSAARDAVDDGVLDGPLTANEAYQLFIGSVDDIAFNPDDDDPERYPSHVGWDQFFGYGRPNAHRMVAAVAAGEIPPEADIDAPRWFAVYNLDETPSIDVTGLAAANRAGSLTWELAVAPGMDPRDDDFEAVASGSSAVDGVLGNLDLASIPMDPSAVIEDFDRWDTNVSKVTKVHVHAATVRLEVTDDAGRVGRMRRTIFVQQDPDLMPGTPKHVGASLEPSVTLVDVDGDGIDDVVYATSDGRITAADGALTPLPGWPVSMPLLEEVDPDWPANHLVQDAYATGDVSADHRHGMISTPAVADLDGDGVVEVVAASLAGAISVWHADGEQADGWPYILDRTLVVGLNQSELNNYDYGVFGAPALGDMDGDGDLEVVVGAMDSRVYVFHHDGSLLDGFPLELRHEYETSQGTQSRGERIISSPALGDVDDDGHLEIVIGTNQKTTGTYGLVYMISHDGQVEPGWPVALFGAYTNALPFVGEGVAGSPALCDADGDGKLEIGTHTIADSGKIYRWDGSEYARLARIGADFGPYSNTAEEAANLIMINSGAWGDLDVDGVPDYFVGGMGLDWANGMADDGHRHDFDMHLGGWSGAPGDGVAGPTMPFLPAFPRIMEDLQFFLNPSIADIDGDGRPEVINGSAGSVVHAFNSDGAEPAGWPKDAAGWMMGSPTLGDADGDGYLEVWTGTRGGYLFGWKTTALASEAYRGWTGFRHDPRNTGNCETALRTYPPIPEDESCDGCSLAAPGSAGLSVLLLALVFVRRRRDS